MLLTELDHLVVTAPDLRSGIEWVEHRLECRMQPGGRHPRMGTHNALVRIGPRSYLEVIAIDPDAAPIQRPRWFDLDSLHSGAAPRLATWVLRTNGIRDVAEKLSGRAGPVEAMTRGTLSWQITIPVDGKLPFSGLLPAIIQWDSEPHPATLLPESPVSLVQLIGFCPEASEVHQCLASVGSDGELRFSVPEQPGGTGLRAVFRNAAGKDLWLE
jgi:hypothetical protein